MNPKETANKRDAREAQLFEQLVEIEQRLISHGTTRIRPAVGASGKSRFALPKAENDQTPCSRLALRRTRMSASDHMSSLTLG